MVKGTDFRSGFRPWTRQTESRSEAAFQGIRRVSFPYAEVAGRGCGGRDMLERRRYEPAENGRLLR